jgi:hypothetical protein
MAPFVEYCRIRLADDPHLWASALLDELRELGYAGSYPSLTAAIRTRGLRPHCEPCQASAGRDAAIIAHPPGEETQFDWVELPGPPPGWGCGAHAHLLAGALSASGRWRGVLAEAEDFAHLTEALDAVARRLGGLTRRWRFDRMATVCHPGRGKLTATFAALAKYYEVGAAKGRSLQSSPGPGPDPVPPGVLLVGGHADRNLVPVRYRANRGQDRRRTHNR